MRKITEYMDLARARQHIGSDRALAGHLDVAQSVVSQIRSGRIRASERVFLKLAELAHILPEEALTDWAAMRHPDGPVREAWDKINAIVQRNAAAVLILGGFLGGGILGTGTMPEQGNQQSPHNVYYDKLRTWARLILMRAAARVWLQSLRQNQQCIV